MGELDLMPYEEYLEWQEFYEIEPFGLMVRDASQAHIASILANTNRDTKKRSKPYTLEEFLLFKEREQKSESPDGVLLADPDAQTELMIAAMFGGMNVIRAD